jgi:hypothetical protein
VVGDHCALSLHLDEADGWVYFSIFIGAFYAGQSSLMSRWVERFKMVFTILVGREYQFEDIILDREAVKKVTDFLLLVEDD